MIGPPPTHSQYKGGPSTPLLAGYSPLPKMGLWGRREEWEFGPCGSHERTKVDLYDYMLYATIYERTAQSV